MVYLVNVDAEKLEALCSLLPVIGYNYQNRELLLSIDEDIDEDDVFEFIDFQTALECLEFNSPSVSIEADSYFETIEDFTKLCREKKWGTWDVIIMGNKQAGVYFFNSLLQEYDISFFSENFFFCNKIIVINHLNQEVDYFQNEQMALEFVKEFNSKITS